MPDAPAEPQRRRQEGWFGVLVTAALCAIFLWWWFLPEPVSSETERDPLHWVGLARGNLGHGEPTLAMRFEIIMIAEALRQRGEHEAAGKLEADWLPPQWPRAAASGENAPDEAAVATAVASTTPAVPGELAPIRTRLDEAAGAFDTLEIEDGQAILRQAAEAAAVLPEPARSLACWLVAARQARNGLAADAVATRQRAPAAAGGPDFPDWLVTELFGGDILAPVVAARGSLPVADPQVISLAARWRALVRERLVLRDHPLLTRHGPAADASRTAGEAAAGTLWAAVEANRLGEAARLAGDDPSSQLAVARLLTWLAAPAP